MKDLLDLAKYGIGTIVVSVVLYWLYTSEIISGSAVGFIAIFIVIVVPIALSVVIGKREQTQKQHTSEE